MVVHFSRITYAQDVFPAEKSPISLKRPACVTIEVVQRVVSSQQRVVLDLSRDPANAAQGGNVCPSVIRPERIIVTVNDKFGTTDIEWRIKPGNLLPLDSFGSRQITAVQIRQMHQNEVFIVTL